MWSGNIWYSFRHCTLCDALAAHRIFQHFPHDTLFTCVREVLYNYEYICIFIRKKITPFGEFITQKILELFKLKSELRSSILNHIGKLLAITLLRSIRFPIIHLADCYFPLSFFLSEAFPHAVFSSPPRRTACDWNRSFCHYTKSKQIELRWQQRGKDEQWTWHN